MTIVNAIVIFFAIIGLFFSVSFVYGLLSVKKDKPSDNAVKVGKGYMTSAIINHGECPYVFSSPKRVYSESNSAIFMVLSAVLDGKEFPDLKVGDTHLTFIQAINNSTFPVTPKYLQNLIIESQGEIIDVPFDTLPTQLPKDLVKKVREEMDWGSIDLGVYNRSSAIASFMVEVSDFESFVKGLKSVKLGYNNRAQDILLAESSFVTIDNKLFADCIKTAVLEWTETIKKKVDSISVSEH